jgi:putative DNA primase/helicase
MDNIGINGAELTAESLPKPPVKPTSKANGNPDPYPNFPDEFKQKNIWCLWKREFKDGEWKKIPYRNLGQRARSNDSSTWVSYGIAVSNFRYKPEEIDGIGVFVSDGITFIDFDDCRNADTGEIEPWATEVLADLNSYTEVSPSGTGLHVYVRGAVETASKINGCEVYGKDRFFTVTGKHVDGTPLEINEYPRLAGFRDRVAGNKLRPYPLQKAGTARGKSKKANDLIVYAPADLDTLLRGDWEGGRYYSQSEADLAAWNLLLRRYDGHVEKAEEVFRASGLMRDKWDEYRGAKTYGEKTIALAVKSYTEWQATTTVVATASGVAATADGETEGYGSLQTYTELKKRRQNAKPYLVENICRRGQIVVVVGDSSLGKSALVNQLGWAVATGQPFLGRATQQAKALIIDIENSADQQLELAECFRKMFDQAEFPESIALPENVWTDVAGQKQLEHFIASFKPGIVIIDSLKSFQCEAEKAGKENGLFMQWARRITKSYDCAMVLVHHPRKPSAETKVEAPWLGDENLPVITWMNGAAGAKGLINLADVRWGVDRAHDEKECFVMRINERTVGDSGVMRVVREYDDEGREAGYSLRHGLSLLTDAQIEKYISLPQEFHFTDACKACGGAKSVASRLINRAKQAGALRQVGRGKYEKIRTADRDETEEAFDKDFPF